MKIIPQHSQQQFLPTSAVVTEQPGDEVTSAEPQQRIPTTAEATIQNEAHFALSLKSFPSYRQAIPPSRSHHTTGSYTSNRRRRKAVKNATYAFSFRRHNRHAATSQIRAAVSEGGDVEDPSSPVGAILPLLRDRMRHSNWVVVLKTQILFHALFRRGNPRFVDYLAEEPSDTFDRSGFQDRSRRSPDHAPIIKTYATYLSRWLIMHKETSFLNSSISAVQNTHMFDKSSVQELVTALPHILYTVEALQFFPIEESFKNSQVFQPVFYYLLSDQQVFFVTLSKAISKLVNKFFSFKSAEAVPALAICLRYLQAYENVLPVINELRTITPRLQFPRLFFSLELAVQMQQYIDDGCEQKPDEQGVKLAVKRATMPNKTPPSEEQLQTVLNWRSAGDPSRPEEPVGMLLQTLRDRLRSSDWRIVIKAMVLFRALLHGCDQRLASKLSEYAELSFGSEFAQMFAKENNPDAEMHGPLILWYASYLRKRSSRLQEALMENDGPSAMDRTKAFLESKISGSGNGRKHAYNLLRSLSRGMDLIDALQEFHLDDQILKSSLAGQVYLQIILDVKEVFVAVVKRMNEFVGIFFELEYADAVEGLEVFERFAIIADAVDKPGGMFERAMKVSKGWRKPSEVVIEVDVLADMRIYVESLIQDEGDDLECEL